MAWNPKSMGNRNKLIYNFTIQAYQKLILSALGLITCVNIMLKCTLSIIAFGVQTLPQVRKLMSLLSTILVALAEYHFSIVLQSFVPITNNVHM